MTEVVELTVNPRPKPRGEFPVNHQASLTELPLPEPEHLTPSLLLQALARSLPDDFQHAVVVVTRNDGEAEYMRVYEAGPEMSNERIVWLAQRLIRNAMGDDDAG